jgi:predicted signal transduction protein with EAL and GGDEF domain
MPAARVDGGLWRVGKPLAAPGLGLAAARWVRTVARLGREEFLVIGDQARAAAWDLAGRLRERWHRSAPRTSVSIGVTVRATALTLIRADEALYEAQSAPAGAARATPRARSSPAAPTVRLLRSIGPPRPERHEGLLTFAPRARATGVQAP